MRRRRSRPSLSGVMSRISLSLPAAAGARIIERTGHVNDRPVVGEGSNAACQSRSAADTRSNRCGWHPPSGTLLFTALAARPRDSRGEMAWVAVPEVWVTTEPAGSQVPTTTSGVALKCICSPLVELLPMTLQPVAATILTLQPLPPITCRVQLRPPAW